MEQQNAAGVEPEDEAEVEAEDTAQHDEAPPPNAHDPAQTPGAIFHALPARYLVRHLVCANHLLPGVAAVGVLAGAVVVVAQAHVQEVPDNPSRMEQSSRKQKG